MSEQRPQTVDLSAFPLLQDDDLQEKSNMSGAAYPVKFIDGQLRHTQSMSFMHYVMYNTTHSKQSTKLRPFYY